MSAARTWADTAFGAMRHPIYRQLWFGSTLASLTFAMMFVAQAVVAFDLTGRNGAVGAIALASGITQAITAPFGGAVADRVSRRRLLFAAQFLVGLNFVVVGTLLLTDVLTIEMLLASAFVNGITFGFLVPARQAYTGEALPVETVASGIALQQLSMTAMRVVGPVIVGAMVAAAFIGAGGTYVVMGSLMFVVVGLLLKLPPSVPRNAAGSTVLRELTAGLRYSWGHRTIRLQVLTLLGVLCFGGSYIALLPGFLDHALGEEKEGIAWLYGAAGLGGLLASLVSAGFAGSRRAPFVLLLCMMVLGLALIGISQAQSLLQAVAVAFAVGAGVSAFQVLNSAILIGAASASHYGRVAALTPMAFGVSQVAQYPIGVAADHVGEREMLLLMGCAVLVVAVATFTARRMTGASPDATVELIRVSDRAG